MLSGINTDIQHHGRTYHVQTEDGGVHNPVITTHLFFGGAIFATQKSTYKDSLHSESLNDVIREKMKEQHKAMIRDLVAGKLQRASEPKPQADSASAHPTEKKKKSLDDLILDYLSQKENS